MSDALVLKGCVKLALGEAGQVGWKVDQCGTGQNRSFYIALGQCLTKQADEAETMTKRSLPYSLRTRSKTKNIRSIESDH